MLEYTLIHDDCVHAMKKLSSNSVDSIVTDPPYGLEFMGKDWDKAVPSVDAWKEAIRVLKPGGFAFIMSSPRLDCLSQMAIRLQEAGFDVGFTPIFWAYASGFPKGTNISKAVDRKLRADRRKVPSTGNLHQSHTHGWSQMPKKDKYLMDDDNPITQQAKFLNGLYAGFQPKPAVEVIIVAQKPLSEKNYVEQALQYYEQKQKGKTTIQSGGTWLDDVRIPSEKWIRDQKKHTEYMPHRVYGDYRRLVYMESHTKGRFPSNLLVSDYILDDRRIRKSTKVDGSKMPETGIRGIYGRYKLLENIRGYEDIVSFSHYFSLDSWFRERFKSLPESIRKNFPFLIVPKASREERDRGLNKTENYHPTVKPIELISYLITLSSREGEIILDPFVGSGTTMIAAKLMGRSCIGIEINEEYMKIAYYRVKHYLTQKILFEDVRFRVIDSEGKEVNYD